MMFEAHIEKLYRINMNLREDETLLLITDDTKPYLADLLEEFYQVGKLMSKRVKKIQYSSLGQHGKEPPEEVWIETFGESPIEELKRSGLFRRVINKESYSEEDVLSILKKHAQDLPHVIIAFPYYSTTHTFYRKVLTRYFGVRYASMPLFEPEMFYGPMDVDWEEVGRVSNQIAEILTEGEWVEIKADGTQLEFSIKGRQAIADTGLFHRPGDYGNLPAGESFIAPVEDSAYGKMTILYGPDRRLDSPITFKFKDGAVEEIEGFDPYVKYLEKVFKEHERARTIAELGVGTNPKAKRVDNVLECEKILGTVHVAIGDNHTFGGINKVPFHTDYVIFEPTVMIGGKGWQKLFLEKGRLRI
ncbi:aminopeptidase [Thermocrinis sp.]|uniref:aminopeptidase n=1 Tax=Thermocrinis sp. TaxID=2024383 RepID=UPI002FDDE7ED